MLRTLRTGLLLPLAALTAALLPSSCKSNDPLYDSHWNVGSLEHRAGYHLFGYDSYTGESIYEHSANSAKDIALTLRRHFLNDNPENPLQYRRGWGADTVYNPTSAYADVWFLARDAVFVGYRGLVHAVVVPIDLTAGPISAHFGADYGSVVNLWGGLGEPAAPGDFEVENP